MSQATAFRHGQRPSSPSKVLLASNAQPDSPSDEAWSLKAHPGGASRIPRPPQAVPTTPGDQGIKHGVRRGPACCSCRHLPPPPPPVPPPAPATQVQHPPPPPPPSPLQQGLFGTPLPTPSQPGLREEALKKIERDIERRLEGERAALDSALARADTAATQKHEVGPEVLRPPALFAPPVLAVAAATWTPS